MDQVLPFSPKKEKEKGKSNVGFFFFTNPLLNTLDLVQRW